MDKLKNRGKDIDAAVEKSVKGKAAPKPKPKAKAPPKEKMMVQGYSCGGKVKKAKKKMK
jgi:hypothetical protein